MKKNFSGWGKRDVKTEESTNFINKYLYLSYIIIIIIVKYVCRYILYCVFFFFRVNEKEKEEVN